MGKTFLPHGYGLAVAPGDDQNGDAGVDEDDDCDGNNGNCCP